MIRKSRQPVSAKNRLPFFVFMVIIVVMAFIVFYKNNSIEFGSDELWVIRSLIGPDWNLTRLPWPANTVSGGYETYPLSYPLGWAYGIHWLSRWINDQPFWLRLMPAIFGFATLILLYFYFIQRFSRPILSGLLTLAAALVADKLTIYAKTLKHYSADGFFTLLFAVILLQFSQNRSKSLLYLCALAPVVIWIAFGTLFTFPALLVVLLIAVSNARGPGPGWPGIARTQVPQIRLSVGVAGILFTASCFALWFSNRHSNSLTNNYLHNFWAAYMFDPDQPLVFLLQVIKQSIKNIYYLFQENWVLTLLLMPIIFLGFIRYWWRRDFIVLGYFVVSIAILMGAALVRIYPFYGGRLLLFSAPIWLILLGDGLVLLGELGAKRPWLAKFHLPELILMALLIVAGQTTGDKLLRGKLAGGRRADLAVRHLQKHAQAGDLVYLHHGAILPFYYYFTDHQLSYQSAYALSGNRGHIQIFYGGEFGSQDPLYTAEAARLLTHRGRIWMFFSHLWPESHMEKMLAVLAENRTTVEQIQLRGTFLVLFDQ